MNLLSHTILTAGLGVSYLGFRRMAGAGILQLLTRGLDHWRAAIECNRRCMRAYAEEWRSQWESSMKKVQRER